MFALERLTSILLLLGGLALLAVSVVAAEPGPSASPVVAADGAIRLPADFRARFVHLGSWFVPEGAASGFHDVYADAAAVAGYRATGVFPDGSVLVKEVRASAAGDYTTGAGVSHATDRHKQWFVMVKDAKGRFPGDPRWGDGWGWALFEPSDPSRSVSKSYRSDCLGCHLPARDGDYVYLEAYPTLSK